MRQVKVEAEVGETVNLTLTFNLNRFCFILG